MTPHVAQKIKGSAIDGRTTRHAGYGMSQQKRKLVEEAVRLGQDDRGHGQGQGARAGRVCATPSHSQWPPTI